jgi:hypothetical protein
VRRSPGPLAAKDLCCGDSKRTAGRRLNGPGPAPGGKS